MNEGEQNSSEARPDKVIIHLTVLKCESTISAVIKLVSAVVRVDQMITLINNSTVFSVIRNDQGRTGWKAT